MKYFLESNRLSKYLRFSLKWHWQYIFYPIEVEIKKKNIFGESKPFKELVALTCNKYSAGPLLPRIGDVIKVPSFGSPGGLQEAKVQYVDFDLPIEEIRRDKTYFVYLDTEREDSEYFQNLITKHWYGGWNAIIMSDLNPGSYWFSVLPGARWFKPDYLDVSIKEKEFEKLKRMPKSDIRNDRKKLLYLRHHFMDADSYLDQ